MASFPILIVRDGSAPPGITPTVLNLLIAVIVLFTLAAILIVSLLVLRSVRRSRISKEQLPLYDEKPARVPNPRGLSIRTDKRTTSIVFQEKQNLIENSSSPPPSPIPEIRITFPEEIDESGKRQSGRVVVVRVGDHSVGLEPIHETLPPYQQSESDRFQSLDLERIGGLKEKDFEKRYP
jgi:hypothetical protein